MKIVTLVAGALFATQALSADFELSDGLLDTVSAGTTACGASGCYELLESAQPTSQESVTVSLPALPSFINVRTPRDAAPVANAAVTISRPALEMLQRDSSSWQGGLADPITIERLAQPQRSSTQALQRFLSTQ